jgi:hypothetical protein
MSLLSIDLGGTKLAVGNLIHMEIFFSAKNIHWQEDRENTSAN